MLLKKFHAGTPKKLCLRYLNECVEKRTTGCQNQVSSLYTFAHSIIEFDLYLETNLYRFLIVYKFDL